MDERQNPSADQMPTEEQLRAFEEQLKQVRIEDVLVQTVVSLLNMGGRRAGLAPGSEDERDPEQLRLAIEGVRALLPLVEGLLGDDAQQLRGILSQLQMAYASLVPPSGAQAEGAAGPPKPSPDAPGPAQASGRLWVPGQ